MQQIRSNLQMKREAFQPFPDLPADPEGVLDRWLESLKVWPLGAYECWSPEGWTFGPRIKGETIWFWVESGDMLAEIGEGDRRHVVDSRHIMIIPQNVRHSLRAQRGGRLHFTTVHFHASISGVDLTTLLGFPTRIPCRAESPFPEVSRRMVREFGLMAPGWRQVMTAEITRALCHIVRHHGSLLALPTGRAATESLPRLLPALQLVEKRLADPALGVSDLARAVFVSEVYLRKLFRSVTGMSPVDFVQKQRVLHASSLLRTTNLAAKEIAERCGFSEQTFFYRVFRKWTGVTPVQYRRGENVE